MAETDTVTSAKLVQQVVYIRLQVKCLHDATEGAMRARRNKNVMIDMMALSPLPTCLICAL